MNAAEETLVAAWLQTPLTFRRVLFVSAPVEAFGVYTPRESAVFNGKAPLVIYAEPVGYGWRAQGDLNETDFGMDMAIKDTAGQVVFEKKDMLVFKIASHVKNREVHITATLNLTGAPAGKYIAVGTLHDHVTNKSNSFELPFEIQE